MTLLLKLSWRNILRNKRRTFLSGLAIGIGLASLIFTDALMIGTLDSMIRTATDTFLGHAQIHATGFRETYETEKTIHNIDKVIAGLQSEDAVKNFSVRTQAFSMITSPANVSSIILYGIDPAREKALSKIDDFIVQGEYLATIDDRKVLIGDRLAESLEVEIGDRIVVTTAQADSGELAQEMFRVGGIYHFNAKEMDGNVAFVHLDHARTLLSLGGRAHEIAVQFHDINASDNQTLPFWEKYSDQGNEALGWRELLKELDAVLKMSDFTKYIMAFILFGIVGLIILNTLFTSLYERLFEFGILRAVGTRPIKMSLIILFESISLALVSSVLGIILGLTFSYIFSIYGIDYRGMEFADVSFRELIYPVMTVAQYIRYPVWVIFFAIIAGLYPAIFAARLLPANVLRRSM